MGFDELYDLNSVSTQPIGLENKVLSRNDNTLTGNLRLAIIIITNEVVASLLLARLSKYFLQEVNIE